MAVPAALYFDYTSPSSLVAVLQFEAFLSRGAEITFVGVDVLGLSIAIPASPALHHETTRWSPRAADLAFPLTTPTWQPPTRKAHLVGQLAADTTQAQRWRTSIFRAYWQDAEPIDDEAVLARIATDCGFSAESVTAVLTDAHQARALTKQMAQHRRRGIGDVPVLEVHGNFISPHLAPADLAALLGVTR